jgi:hypothetical protein
MRRKLGIPDNADPVADRQPGAGESSRRRQHVCDTRSCEAITMGQSRLHFLCTRPPAEGRDRDRPHVNNKDRVSTDSLRIGNDKEGTGGASSSLAGRGLCLSPYPGLVRKSPGSPSATAQATRNSLPGRTTEKALHAGQEHQREKLGELGRSNLMGGSPMRGALHRGRPMGVSHRD